MTARDPLALVAARDAILREIAAFEGLPEAEYNKALVPYWDRLNGIEAEIEATVPASPAEAAALLRYVRSFCQEGWARGKHTRTVELNVIAGLERLA